MNITYPKLVVNRTVNVLSVPTIPTSNDHTDGTWMNTDIYEGELFLNLPGNKLWTRYGATAQLINNYATTLGLAGSMLQLTRKDGSVLNADLSSLISGLGIVSKTYSELKAMYDGSTLTPGQLYKMSDFVTVHNILDGNTTSGDINTGINEPLILTATSTNTFDKQVYSTLYPEDIIYYDITGGDTRDIAFFDTGVAITGLKGVIYYRKDTIQNVECWYDFRNVKYRRWLVSATDWIASGTYVATNVYEYDSILYKCIKDHTGLTDTPNLDTTNWIKWLDKTKNWSWTSDKTQFNIGHITTDNLIMSDPIDVYTFGNYYERVNNVEIGKIYLDYVRDYYKYSSKLNNIVFYTTDISDTCFSNVFGDNCFLNTVGNNFYGNTVGNDFMYNTVGNYFNNNTVGNNFYGNTVGNYFNNNTVGNYFNTNTVGNYFNNNTVGNYFGYNTVGKNFITNTVGYNFGHNTVGNSSNNNTVGNGFNYNTVGNGFNYNTVGNNFNNNTVGNNFYYNTVGNDFNTNTVGNGFNDNTVGDSFNNNTVGNYFCYNTVGNNFSHNTVGYSFNTNTVRNNFNINTVGTDFQNNTVGTYFNNNTVGDEFTNNTVGNNFYNNKVGNNFKYNDLKYSPTSVNFTTATHVYANYTCEIIKNSAGVFRLKYLDSTDIEVITNITA